MATPVLKTGSAIDRRVRVNGQLYSPNDITINPISGDVGQGPAVAGATYTVKPGAVPAAEAIGPGPIQIPAAPVAAPDAPVADVNAPIATVPVYDTPQADVQLTRGKRGVASLSSSINI